MANSISTQPWSLRMDAGAEQQWLFTFTTGAPGGTTPWPISGATWEYVARTSATDLTVPPLIKINTSAGSAGLLTVTSTATTSSVQLAMYPAATVSLTPGTFYQALWMWPGTTSAVTIFNGLLLINGAPQP
jgi:hypothetical protein